MRPPKTAADIGRWDGTVIRPGEQGEAQIAISETYAGVSITIPVFVWRGAQPGPNVFVTGAVHGDEINGAGAIRHLIVEQPFELRAGTLLLVPVVNLLGFERFSRYLPDRRDLNRSFPGSKDGSVAARLARAVFDAIVRRCDFGIDLHTAAVRRTNFPNVRADLRNPALAQLARAFGTELIVSSTGPVGSLRNAATRAGCPTLILEAGEVWKVEPTVLEYATRGVRNCLVHLGMVDGEIERPAYQFETDATSWVRARRGGFLRFHVTLGDLVDKGEPIATNTSLMGRELNVVKSPRSGVVLGMTTLPSVAPGDPICHLAFPKRGALRRVEKAHSGFVEDSLHERTRDDLATSVLVSESGADGSSEGSA